MITLVLVLRHSIETRSNNNNNKNKNLILSGIYHRDPTRYYACARLVILRERSPSCSVVGFPASVFPVNLHHPVEICEANQFFLKVSFTFPQWRRKIARKPKSQNLPQRSRVRHEPHLSGKAHLVLLGTFNRALPRKQRLLAQPDFPVPHLQDKPKRPASWALPN